MTFARNFASISALQWQCGWLECVGAAVGVGRAAEGQFPKSFRNARKLFPETFSMTFARNLTSISALQWQCGWLEKKFFLPQDAAVSSADTLECVGAAMGVGRAAEEQFPKSFRNARKLFPGNLMGPHIWVS